MFFTNLLLSHPFKLINQISTVQVVSWLPSIILVGKYIASLLTAWKQQISDWDTKLDCLFLTSSPKPRHLSKYSVFPFLPTLLSITLINSCAKPFLLTDDVFRKLSFIYGYLLNGELFLHISHDDLACRAQTSLWNRWTDFSIPPTDNGRLGSQ